jgi:hypothetical protein
LQIVFTEVFRTLAWERKCEHVFPAYKFRNRSVHRLVVRIYIFLGECANERSFIPIVALEICDLFSFGV